MKNPFRLQQLRSISKATLYLLVLGIGIGLLMTVQWKTKPLRASSDPVNYYVSLKDTKEILTEEQTNLKNEIEQKQSEIEQKQELLKKYTSSKKTIEELESYKKRLGLTEVKDSGVVITIDDSDSNNTTVDSITHAADIRDLVNFLWGVGAEAISINNERIVFSTSIDCIVNTILINSTKTTAPFTINAIGDGKIMEKQLNNPNNLKDIKKRIKSEGLVFNISTAREIVIPAYKGSFVMENSRIMEE